MITILPWCTYQYPPEIRAPRPRVVCFNENSPQISKFDLFNRTLGVLNNDLAVRKAYHKICLSQGRGLCPGFAKQALQKCKQRTPFFGDTRLFWRYV